MDSATFIAPEQTDVRQITAKDGSIWPTNFYFGRYGDDASGPQAFHVHREPQRESRAHFHHVDQFQIFFGAADTTFQRHLTGPLLIHYSDADTLYGPFSSGDEPFSFMTLRPHGSDFKGHMPENKAEMSHGMAKRHYHHDLGEWINTDIGDADEAAVQTILEPHEDLLGAVRVAMPAGSKFQPSSAAGSGGQYHVVVDGELLHDGALLPKYSIGWVDRDEEAPVLVAGDSGAKLVVLQFGANAQAV